MKLDKKDKYIATLAAIYVISVGLFFWHSAIQESKISEITYNASFDKQTDSAIITTYQTAICNYETQWVYNIPEFWVGKIDEIGYRTSKINQFRNETILAWVLGCYNETGKEKIAIAYRYPPAEQIQEINTTTQNETLVGA